MGGVIKLIVSLYVFRPTVEWVQAAVEGGTEWCDGNQVATHGLQDAPVIVSAYEEEKT